MNIMPCVLPVLGIKLRSVSKADKKTFKKIFLFTAFGILTSFIGFALFAIFLRHFFQQEMGWGTQFQNPYFVSCMIVASLLFSLSLLGVFHLRTPGWISKIIPKTNSEVMQSFFSGAFTVLLSTPCCAPFMGSALGFALTRNAPEILMVFTSIGSGFALPYILGSFLPIARFIPKPGKWSLYMEYASGILLLGSVIWFLSVLASLQSINEKIVSRFLISLAVLSICVGKNSKIKKKSNTLSNVFSYVIPSTLFLSFVLLPMYKKSLFDESSIKNKIELGKLKWQTWSQKGMDQKIKEGKVVFASVTASWCFSCQVNKKSVILDKDIQNLLASDDITVMIADWTEKSQEIESFLKKHERVGIPFNIVISKWLSKWDNTFRILK